MNSMAFWRPLLAAATMAAAVLPAAAVQVVVGQVAPMSGLEARQGRAFGVGLKLSFDAINKAGGINGHTLGLVRKDDLGQPEQTVALTKALVAESRPMVLAGYFGTRNIAALVASGTLEKEKLALVGYRSSELRAPPPLLFNMHADLREELTKITRHLATIGINRLGVFYEDVPASGELLKLMDELAAASSSRIVVRASYPAGTTKVGDAAEAFLKEPPQAIVMLTSTGAAAAFIERYRMAPKGTAQLVAHSGVDVEQLSQRLSEQHMQGIVIAQVTPSPFRISSKLTREFIEATAGQTLEVPVSYSMFEGYITGRVIAEAVRRQGRTPTREGMAAALASLVNFDFGGYVVDLGPNAGGNGTRFVELTILSNAGKIRQ